MLYMIYWFTDTNPLHLKIFTLEMNNLYPSSIIKIIISGETLLGEIFVRQNYSSGDIFVTKRKIRHFRPTKSFALWK